GETAPQALGLAGWQRLLDLLSGTQPQKQVRQRKACGVIDPFLFRAGLAQIDLLGLAFDHLSQVHGGDILFADIAEHIS
ncbi:MAG: hypothetical protein K9N62_20175, partial [Verrucomicrobia bacterium]|nr:hypothetical protein [Verrucomicrobiota bacterium]